MTADAFQPMRILEGGHLQTIGGHLLRTALRWRHATEDVLVDAEEDVRILLRASWQPDGSDRPALLLVHGLEGCDRSPYVLSTGALAYRLGWHVVRMNMRGCGDSLSLCPHLYNAGLSSDLVAACEWLASRVSRFAVAGFSLGAGMTLLTLARERGKLPAELEAAAAVCPPLNMSRCADALERPANRLYHRRFVGSLVRTYRHRQHRSNGRYEAGLERGIRTVRAFDEIVTARYGGYRDAEDYYGTVSAGPRLGAIDRPTLVLGSANDPVIPADSLSGWSPSSSVRLEVSALGGHVGFVGRTRAPRRFWAAERVLSFLATSLDLDERHTPGRGAP